MTDATAEQAEAPQKTGIKGPIIAVILAAVGAVGGYFLTTSGMLPLGDTPTTDDTATMDQGKALKALPKVEYIDLPPVIVSVNAGDSRHLKFHAQLEVNAEHAAEVDKLKPRIMDILNGYLRAVEVSDLEDSLALMRIRGHLLRRIEIVVGEGRVRDVLVMQFILN